MKRQVRLELISKDQVQLSFQNINGFLFSEVVNKIQKHTGKWSPQNKRYQLPSNKISSFIKDIETLGSQIFIEPIPHKVMSYLSNFHEKKIKRKMLIDDSSIHRFQYVQKILQEILNSNVKSNNDKNILFCRQAQVQKWLAVFNKSSRELIFKKGEVEEVEKESCLWICPYSRFFQNASHIQKYPFKNAICDDAEILIPKFNEERSDQFTIRGYFCDRLFLYFILSKSHLNNFDILFSFLTVINTKQDLNWMKKRYKKQYLEEFYFVIKKCCFLEDLEPEPKEEQEAEKNQFCVTPLKMNEDSMDKIRGVNRKFSTLNHKKILQSPKEAKGKQEKIYLDNVIEKMTKAKMPQILSVLEFYCQTLKKKIIVFIETSKLQKIIQDHFLERQIDFSHYQNPAEMIQFNNSLDKYACLVKVKDLLEINPSEHKEGAEDILKNKFSQCNPERYQCIANSSHLFFPDITWTGNIKQREQNIEKLLHYGRKDLTRHYFVLKGTYEERWIESLKEEIARCQMLIPKDNINSQDSEDDSQDHRNFWEPFEAKIKEKFEDSKVQGDVFDVDDQFDKFQYEAMVQKEQRQQLKKQKKQRLEKERLEKQQQKIEDEKKRKERKHLRKYSESSTQAVPKLKKVAKKDKQMQVIQIKDSEDESEDSEIKMLKKNKEKLMPLPLIKEAKNDEQVDKQKISEKQVEQVKENEDKKLKMIRFTEMFIVLEPGKQVKIN